MEKSKEPADTGELHGLNTDELKQAAGGQDGTAHATPR
jgi:hypothetical protein